MLDGDLTNSKNKTRVRAANSADQGIQGKESL
jgi:hypothetical protein